MLRSPAFFPSVPSGIFAVIGDSFVGLGRDGGEGGVGGNGEQVEYKNFDFIAQEAILWKTLVLGGFQVYVALFFNDYYVLLDKIDLIVLPPGSTRNTKVELFALT